MIAYLLEDFPCQNYDCGCSVPDFCILRSGNIYENLGCRMNNVQQLHNGSSIIGDGVLAILVNEE